MACLNNAQATRVTAGYGSSESSSQMEIDAFIHLFIYLFIYDALLNQKASSFIFIIN
jgi:hypothetical protein